MDNIKVTEIKEFIDEDLYIKAHKIPEVTNPVTIDRKTHEFTEDGLYSPKIFGVTQEEQATNLGHIHLGFPLLNPVIYKSFKLISVQFKHLLEKNKKYTLVDGVLHEDNKHGRNGIKYLYEIWDKINWKAYENDNTKIWIHLFTDEPKSKFWHHNIIVMPVALRPYNKKHGIITIDEITEVYEKILRAKYEKNDYLQKLKASVGGNHELIQKYYVQLFNMFIDTYATKSGEYQSHYAGKRPNNNITLVANSNPEVPTHTCVISWHNLLVLYDNLIIGLLKRDEYKEEVEKLGLSNIHNPNDFGSIFQYIQSNPDIYEKTYPQRKIIWIDLLRDMFNTFEETGIMLKRNPTFETKGYVYYKVIINKNNEAAVLVPPVIYNNLGGDSFYTDKFLAQFGDKYLIDNDKYKVEVTGYSKITPTTNIVDMVDIKDLYENY